MRVGLHLGKFQWEGAPQNIGSKLAEIARAADQMGFYSIWVMDHLFQLGERYGVVHGEVESPMLEGYTTMGYIAGVTTNIRLGLLVTCNFFRSPGLLIKMVSTLDVLSGGRSYLGIGAGWFKEEAVGLGILFPETTRERFSRLEETLQIAHYIWAGETKPFQGDYHHLEYPLNMPQPIAKPHPPILIGGAGEKKTLRFVAQYGDACNFVIPSPQALDSLGRLKRNQPTMADYMDEAKTYLTHKLNTLRQHCDAIERDYETIEKTVCSYLLPQDDNLDFLEEFCHGLAESGFDHVIFDVPNASEIKSLERIARYLPTISELK